MAMIWITALVFALDRASKLWASQVLRALPGGSIALWPGVLHLTYAENTGMAFSLLSGQRWLLILMPILICLGIVIVLLRARSQPRYPRALGWALLGGALGNLFDRIAYGYVVDFLEIKLFRFAIFNLADTVVCVAGVLLALWLLRPEHSATP